RRDASGATNVPAPKNLAPPGKPLTVRLFALDIGKIRIEGGTINYNDFRLQLSADGGFALTLDESAPSGQPIYVGQLAWKNLNLAAARYLPFSSNLSAKFTLERDSFAIEQLNWKLPHSEIDAHAELASFAAPGWKFRYRARIDLADLRQILRQ